MHRKRRPWPRIVEELGVSVRIYEREPGSLLYRQVRIDGAKDRKSLGHRDRTLAETQALALAKRRAELQYAGHAGPVTLGQLTALYIQHRGPLLTPRRAKAVRSAATLLERHFTRDHVIDDLSQHSIDSYVSGRRGIARERPAFTTERSAMSWRCCSP